MLVGLIVCVLVGVLCIVLGILLWKKQMISLVHDYHYRHVSKSDVPADGIDLPHPAAFYFFRDRITVY